MPKKKLKVKKPNTRERLLDAAVQNLTEGSVYGMRYSQIAKVAKVPQALMGYHFPSPDELFYEMIQRETQKFKELTMEALELHADNPQKALEAYIRVPFDLAEQDPGFRAVWSSFYHLATVNPNFSRLNRAIRDMGRERISNLIVMTLAKNQTIQNKVNEIPSLATTIQGIITGFVYLAASESEGNYKKLADLAVNATKNLLGLKK